MLKRLLETVRKYPILSPFLCLYGVVIVVLAAFYYQYGFRLWYAVLRVLTRNDADGKWAYQNVARGPSLLLPWNLLPQHVFWLALAVLAIGSLTIWWAWRSVGDELRYRLAGREKAAEDKLQEAAQQSAAADSRMREAEAWEQRLKARESQAEARESEVANRELAAQAHTEEKDAEVRKMSVALTRLKTEVTGLRKEVRQLRGGS